MAKDDDTWYLVWPDSIEPISWKEYNEGHKVPHILDNWIHARGPFPSHRMAVEWMHYDSLPGYWKHGLAVYADHCLNCGAYAKVLAFDDSAGWAWRVTECKRCNQTVDSRTLEHWRYRSHKGDVWCRCGERMPDDQNMFTWYSRHAKNAKD